MLRWAFFAGLLSAMPLQAQCLPERVLPINVRATPSFGSLRKFPPLPLDAHEYVLTFDDGPSSKSTEGILAALKDACVHATFFMLGRYTDRYPILVRKIIDAGNSVGSHAYDHADLTKLPFDEALSQMSRGKDAVERASTFGRRPITVTRLFRFPDNYETPQLLSAANALGMTVASYDFSPADWRNDPPDITFQRLSKILDHVDRGVIVMHEGQPNTLPLLPMVFAELRRRNARIVTLAPN